MPQRPTGRPSSSPSKPSAQRRDRPPLKPDADGVVRLSGGNPQIAKGDGDGPVQAYLAAMPGWQREVGRAIDALVVATVPDVRKAVRWNSPFYGVADDGWFMGLHCLTRYVKVAFFKGRSLDPMPPIESKKSDVRYFHVHEGDAIDEQQFRAWIRQAATTPGERMF